MIASSERIVSKPVTTVRVFSAAVALVFSPLRLTGSLPCAAQQASAPAQAASPTTPVPPAPEKPLPGLDLSSIDLAADPCTDMYKFACGKFNDHHPIPLDQSNVDPFYRSEERRVGKEGRS